MNEKLFAKRLTELRLKKGVSARDMSLSIGQNPGYINNIESGKAFPSMNMFFCICEYLNLTPQDFFDFGEPSLKEISGLLDTLKQLNHTDLTHITAIAKRLADEVK